MTEEIKKQPKAIDRIEPHYGQFQPNVSTGANATYYTSDYYQHVTKECLISKINEIIDYLATKDKEERNDNLAR